jgi:hypothetical protein
MHKAGGGTPGFGTHPCFLPALPPCYHCGGQAEGCRIAHRQGRPQKGEGGAPLPIPAQPLICVPVHNQGGPLCRSYPQPPPSCMGTRHAAAGVICSLCSRIALTCEQRVRVIPGILGSRTPLLACHSPVVWDPLLGPCAARIAKGGGAPCRPSPQPPPSCRDPPPHCWGCVRPRVTGGPHVRVEGRAPSTHVGARCWCCARLASEGGPATPSRGPHPVVWGHATPPLGSHAASACMSRPSCVGTRCWGCVARGPHCAAPSHPHPAVWGPAMPLLGSHAASARWSPSRASGGCARSQNDWDHAHPSLRCRSPHPVVWGSAGVARGSHCLHAGGETQV